MREQRARPRTPATLAARLYVALSAGMCLGLVACGVAPYASAGSTTTPGTTPAGVAATPSGTGPADASGAVRLVWDQAHFATTDTLRLTITNGLGKPIYTQTNHSDCEAVTLERLVNGVWRVAAGCGGAFPRPELVMIAPGGTLPQALAPGAGGGPVGIGTSGGPGSAWPAGTYRVALDFVTDEQIPMAQGVVAYSTNVAVG